MTHPLAPPHHSPTTPLPLPYYSMRHPKSHSLSQGPDATALTAGPHHAMGMGGCQRQAVVVHYFFAALTGSLIAGKVANSTFCSSPSFFSTLRM
jgi:hypothetical protein